MEDFERIVSPYTRKSFGVLSATARATERLAEFRDTKTWRVLRPPPSSRG